MNFTAYFGMSYKFTSDSNMWIFCLLPCVPPWLTLSSPPLTHIHETDIQQLQTGGARSTTFMPQNQFAYGGNIGYK